MSSLAVKSTYRKIIATRSDNDVIPVKYKKEISPFVSPTLIIMIVAGTTITIVDKSHNAIDIR